MLMGKKIIGTIAYMGGVMSIPEPFVWSLAQMIQYNTEYLCEPGEIIHYIRATVSYHSFARNCLVDGMRGDWLLMLDTDHSFEPDIAARMLRQMDRHNVDVLSAIYQYKSPPYCPVLYRLNDNKDGFEMIGDWDKTARIFEIGSSGAGCLLVKRSVFKRIKDELKEGPFDIIPPFSEDHSFFKRLAKLDIKAYCDPNIECHHLTLKPLSLENYDKSELQFSEKKEVGGRI